MKTEKEIRQLITQLEGVETRDYIASLSIAIQLSTLGWVIEDNRALPRVHSPRIK